MKICRSLILLSLVGGFTSSEVKSGEKSDEKSDGLVAISSGSFVSKLYLKVGNKHAPTPESDAAFADASTRQRICHDITHSGYFEVNNSSPVDMEPSKLSITLADDVELFRRIYVEGTPTPSSASSMEKSHSGRWRWQLYDFFVRPTSPSELAYDYRNAFFPRAFQIRDSRSKLVEILEEVFVCLLKDKLEGRIYPYYVSKEYNVVGIPSRAGRFVFTERQDKFSPAYAKVLLAEEPATVYTEEGNPDYNVELQYLKRRQNRPLAKGDASDPVCKLLRRDSGGRGERLCALVMTSSHFRERTPIGYPQSWFLQECTLMKFSFRTDAARGRVGEKERAVRCQCKNSARNNSYDYFFISRAYAPNEVFVYEHDYMTGKIYLRNLTIDVGIVE